MAYGLRAIGVQGIFGNASHRLENDNGHLGARLLES